MKFPVKKKSIWPYKDTYKGHDLEIFKDGSVVVVKDCLPFIDLTAAFAYIDTVSKANLDKKEKMNTNTITNTFSAGILGTKYHAYDIYDECVSLAPCQSTDCPKVSVQKGNNPMYVDNDKHITSSKINYLSDRANTAYYTKADGLGRAFGFGPYIAPETVQELVDRITAGKFSFKEPSKKDVKNFFYRPWEGITWKDPAVVEDQAGLDKASDELKKLFQDAKDTIAVGTPAEGLVAVKALDAWTPAVTASPSATA